LSDEYGKIGSRWITSGIKSGDRAGLTIKQAKLVSPPGFDGDAPSGARAAAQKIVQELGNLSRRTVRVLPLLFVFKRKLLRRIVVFEGRERRE
jgi:hypothetical protein